MAWLFGFHQHMGALGFWLGAMMSTSLQVLCHRRPCLRASIAWSSHLWPLATAPPPHPPAASLPMCPPRRRFCLRPPAASSAGRLRWIAQNPSCAGSKGTKGSSSTSRVQRARACTPAPHRQQIPGRGTLRWHARLVPSVTREERSSACKAVALVLAFCRLRPLLCMDPLAPVILLSLHSGVAWRRPGEWVDGGP